MERSPRGNDSPGGRPARARMRRPAGSTILTAMDTEPRPPFTSWDDRYGEPGWAFGTEPNDFLRAEAHRLAPASRVLCLAEGEGRNAVYLASLGHRVHAVDASPVGLEKARGLARERGVEITTEVADLADYPISPGSYDAVVSIFAHLPAEIRVRLHAQVVTALAPGGVLLLEGYTAAQQGRGTGGPGDPGKFFTLEALQPELAGLDWVLARETERDVIEGRYHTGRASVVQLVGVRPPA